MLTSARPIFEHVPGSFCDPVGLADQQAHGVVALIVARYDDAAHDPPLLAEQRANPSAPPCQGGVPAAGGGPHGERASAERLPPLSPTLPPPVLGPTYDAFVAVSGQLLAVARSTPDYRFPVQPATALQRFIETRDADRPVFLSLYELDEDDCARFLETVFFSECLKIHVEGAESAALLAYQITRSGCGDGLPSGILELNDFSDPTAPRVRLVDLDSLPPTDLADALRPHLDGVTGRVLLYDRAKNHAALPDRSGHGFDLEAAIAQANRLAEARRGGSPTLPGGDASARTTHRAAAELRASAEDDQTEAVEAYLRDRADHPRLIQPGHPHASALGALVAELQGRTPSAALPIAPEAVPELSATDQRSATKTLPHHPISESPNQPVTPARHPLATELDRLRCDVFALVEDAVSKDRAAAHEAHVLTEHAFPSPVPPEHTPAYLRALLTDDPPRRWHFFKRHRSKTYEEVAGKLLAFHAAHGHGDDPVVHEITKLWTRLHR